jgi:frataxin
LEDIQDAVEVGLERYGIKEEFEIVYSNGVLTMVFPPHGTWVLNKQTPNRQIWWSSPISGPRRYEFEQQQDDDDGGRGRWIYSRDASHSTTLQQTLKEEILQIYNVELNDLCE